MRTLVFATNNKHKLNEVSALLDGKVITKSLSEMGLEGDIPETADTLQGNALQKAQWVWERTHTDCFADDTGLEVDALGGAPGVYSARYAGGVGHDSEANMRKLLKELGENNNRKARFRTVIALIELEKGQTTCFEGIVNGQITRERHGQEGFGYDPIFQPDGYDQTFAQLGMDIKNHISHRAKAVEKLATHLLKKTH